MTFKLSLHSCATYLLLFYTWQRFSRVQKGKIWVKPLPQWNLCLSCKTECQTFVKMPCQWYCCDPSQLVCVPAFHAHLLGLCEVMLLHVHFPVGCVCTAMPGMHTRARGWTCRKPCTVRVCPERGLGGVYAPTLRVLAQCFTSTSAVLLPSRRAPPALSHASRRQSHFLSLFASPRQLEPTFHYTSSVWSDLREWINNVNENLSRSSRYG